jgi:hypothetical protein
LRNFGPTASVKRAMDWRTIVAGVAVLFSLLGCQGSDQATSRADTTSVANTTMTGITEPEPPVQVLTAEEKLLRWIRSCEVRAIIFGHSGTFVEFRGREGFVRLRIGMRAEQRITEAAYAQECEKRILVGIE